MFLLVTAYQSPLVPSNNPNQALNIGRCAAPMTQGLGSSFYASSVPRKRFFQTVLWGVKADSLIINLIRLSYFAPFGTGALKSC